MRYGSAFAAHALQSESHCTGSRALSTPTTSPHRLPPSDDPEENERFKIIDTRCQIAEERWEEVAIQWFADQMGDRASVIGPPDVSVNVLTEIARQLTTPGLYGDPPSVWHTEGSGVLTDTGGIVDQAGVWTKLQQVQFFALCLGDFFVFVGGAAGGGLIPRLVKPHHIEVETDRSRPDVAVVVREWQPADVVGPDGVTKCVYTWWEYDLRALHFRVLSEDKTEDLTARLAPEFLALDPETGDVNPAAAWPWRYANGEPFLPWVHYYWRDTGRFWHHHDMRGLTRGTLNTCKFATLTGHAAESASGKAVIAWGLEPLGDGVTVARGQVNGIAVRTVDLLPGSILYHSPTPNATNVDVREVGPGGEVAVLSAFAWGYAARQAIAFGINPSNILRTTANPDSGSALAIQERGRREFSAMVEPLFRLRDLEFMSKAAAVVRIFGGPELPESGYQIVYRRIPLSADERRELREHLTWQVERGLLSPVDMYLALNPGVSPEAAFAAVVKAQVVAAQLKRAVEKVLAEEDAKAGQPVADTGRPAGDPGTFGAQGGAVQMLVKDVASGQVPREAAIGILTTFFQISAEQAAACLGNAGNGFTPTADTPAPAIP